VAPRTQKTSFDALVQQWRFNMLLLAILGALGLCLDSERQLEADARPDRKGKSLKPHA